MNALWFIVIAVLIIILFEWLRNILKPEPARGSQGQQKIRAELRRRGLQFQEEVPVVINGRRYRFDFKVNNGPWIEFDGAQHFKRIEFFHPQPSDFTKHQERDRIKTRWILNQGESLIRIDSQSDIRVHLDRGLSKTGLYLSNPSLYRFLESSQ